MQHQHRGPLPTPSIGDVVSPAAFQDFTLINPFLRRGDMLAANAAVVVHARPACREGTTTVDSVGPLLTSQPCSTSASLDQFRSRTVGPPSQQNALTCIVESEYSCVSACRYVTVGASAGGL